jgi:3-deoxy-manno-octulosonate cytidylyltransferase (CMP-KDO synthetase)
VRPYAADEDIPNGTERCAQAAERVSGTYDIVVNIQGDEPLIEPEIIDDVVRALQDSPDAVYSTPVTPLKHDEVTMQGRVKCIMVGPYKLNADRRRRRGRRRKRRRLIA